MSYFKKLPPIAILLFSVLAGRAENWPQFRGPTSQGLSNESGLPLQWSASENIAWKTPIPGESWSSPIVWGDRIFLTTATEGGVKCHVLAVDRATGQLVWNTPVFDQQLRRKETRNTYATPTPATDGVRVYACFGDGSFAAVDFEGNVVWVNRNYPFYSQHGLGSSPVLYRDLLIMAFDGSSDGDDKKLGWQTPWNGASLVALDTATGRERWRGERGMSRISHGSPIIWEREGQAEVVSEAGDVVQGFDAMTGQRLWSYPVIGEGKAPTVVIGGGLAFTAGGWGGRESIKAFRLVRSRNAIETDFVWEQRRGMPKIPSMLYVEPHLFAVADDGVATCIKAATGEVVWQKRLGGNFSASPLAAEGRIYFLRDDGLTTIIEAGDEFKILAENPIGERVQASMAVSGGQLFIRGERHLYAIGKYRPQAGSK
jgi:outer membrane protein assembly factor BamB